MIIKFMSALFGWVSGPITSIATTYMKQKSDYQLRKIEQEESRTMIKAALTERVMDDDLRRTAMIDAVIRNDRGDWKTSWIRPVTAALSLLMWVMLFLSQIQLGGNGLLPIIWTVPEGLLGQMFLGFPMGVLTTFYIARPFEKFLLARKGI